MLIVGASGRAAAWSALRAGLSPHVIDLFADVDLVNRCPAQRIDARVYPQGLIEAARAVPPMPVVYTGGLENHPTVITALAATRQLWGNSPEVLCCVRRPENVAELLLRNDLPCPRITARPAADRFTKWLSKPRKSAAGMGIRMWQGEAPSRGRYYQQWIDGESYSAVFVATSGHARLLGITRQLVGVAWLHAESFQYCGNIGPVGLSERATKIVTDLGECLTRGFGLRGLFGVDFVLKDGIPWPVEVNPRYTASVEIIERSSGIRAMGLHAVEFAPKLVQMPSAFGDGICLGKAILFARKPLIFPSAGPWCDWLETNCPAFADIPHAGTRIEGRQPIFTVFSRANEPEACERVLRALAMDLDRWLDG